MRMPFCTIGRNSLGVLFLVDHIYIYIDIFCTSQALIIYLYFALLVVLFLVVGISFPT